ncbi:putative repeat protein (TIGR03943 family) [Anaerosolibacter carboniphilus]|uniref:Putative repeat protein (TIGR03943 family) n=1 Tax=Anaerosolibacter carboniphilus TaxID=1417629 RepID=A0A841KPW0_9FIRM|nr:putative repeat protein (TIGR03943 family) [Anaerosolibacter carboniphilus]
MKRIFTIIILTLMFSSTFVAEALGAKVDWDGATKTGIINSSEAVTKNQATDIVPNGVITFDDKSFGYVNAQIYADPGRYNGKKVIITGFVFRSPDFKENEFKVARKESSGCAADAYVLGLVCRSENAADYENDQWVTVKGTLVVTNYVDPKTNFVYEEVYLEPESIEKIENRTDYYIY